MKRLVYILLIVVVGCVKPYNPPPITGNGNYLVVDGVINAGTDSTIITLSRTVNVSSANAGNPVLNATVAVLSDQNISFPLTETTNGNYVSPGLNLDVNRQYRLSIATNSEQYQSDLVPVTIAPPIDSIGFKIANIPSPGVQIYANTHDARNTVKYYRWDYTETWEFRSYYVSYYVGNGIALGIRPANQQIYECFANDVSSDIVLGSTANLQQDVLYQSPITFIPSTSEKIEDEYSILLRQYALTAGAYNFWLKLKTNTEELGGIFDAQPSEIIGNIHCINNPTEPVIGYVSACTVTSKRIFIISQQLPFWLPAYPYSCMQDTMNSYSPFLIFQGGSTIATGPVPKGNVVPVSVATSDRQCADCTLRGTRARPPFWQ